MLSTINSGELRVTVNSAGAELWAVQALAAGRPETECLWDGSGGHWPRRAPLCFPWCGRLEGDYFEHGGKKYPGGGHGFARDLEHELLSATDTELVYRLAWPGDSERWPWAFELTTRHSVSGRTLKCEVTGVNRSSEPMPAQLGFHPGFRCPLTPGGTPQDCLVRFEKPRTARRHGCFPPAPGGIRQRQPLLREHRERVGAAGRARHGALYPCAHVRLPLRAALSQPKIPGFVLHRALARLPRPRPRPRSAPRRAPARPRREHRGEA